MAKFLGFEFKRAQRNAPVVAPITNTGLLEAAGIIGTGSVNATITSMQKLSAVFQATRLLSQDLAGLGLGFYKKTNGNTEPINNEITQLFNSEVDPFARVTRYKFFELSAKHVVLRGNSYALIHRNPLRLEFIHSTMVSVLQDSITGEVFYRITGKNGPLYGGLFSSDQMLHFKGPGDNPIIGESIIKYGAKSMGIGLSQQALQSKFFENGSIIRDYFSTDKALSDKAYLRMKEDLKNKSGVSNSSETRIFEEGLKYEVVSIKAEDMQLLQSQQLTVVDIARWLNVPPDKLFDWTKISYSSMEQSSANYALQSIAPYATNFQQEINIKLLNPKQGEYCRFNLEALIRADAVAKADSLSKLVNGGVLTQNEAREFYDRNKIEQADSLLFPLNSVPQEWVKDYYEAKILQMQKGGGEPAKQNG